MSRFVGVGLIALALAGCNAFGALEPLLRVEGKSTVETQAPITIQSVVTVRNVGSRPTTISVNSCPVFIELFTTPDRSGEAAWSQAAGLICTAESRLMTLAPGDYYDFHTAATIPSTLPKGLYFISVWGPAGRTVPAGQLSTF